MTHRMIVAVTLIHLVMHGGWDLLKDLGQDLNEQCYIVTRESL